MLVRWWNIWAELSGTPEELAWARAKLTFELARGRTGRRSECLVLSTRPLFPAGWVRSLVGAARREGVRLVLRDERRRPCGLDPAAPIGWLHQHQRDAIRAIDQYGQGMVDHPVGSGKGELIVACPLAFPCRWGLFLQDAALVEQLAERFGKRAPPGTPPVGIVWRDTWRVGERLTIISIQTLDQQWRPDLGSWSPQAKQLLESLEGIEVDECHGSSSATAIRQLRSTPRAWYRVGFSATVRGRSDKRDHVTQGHFGPVICRVEPAELEAQGRISSGQVIMVRVQQDQIPPFQEGGYQAGIVRSRARNQQVLELIRQAPKPTLWFVEEIEHGEILLGLCRQAGLRAVFVQGETPDPLKRQLQRELDLGAVEVGIATNTWKQGIDIVHLRSGGTAAGKKSIILAEQRRGRTVRACQVRTCQVCARDGQKRTFVWYDLYDQAPHRPGQKPHWLELQSRARYRTYQDKGQQVVMR